MCINPNDNKHIQTEKLAETKQVKLRKSQLNSL
jgi:hypothetical protein